MPSFDDNDPSAIRSAYPDSLSHAVSTHATTSRAAPTRAAPSRAVPSRAVQRREPILIAIFGLLLAAIVAFVIVLSQLNWVGKQVSPFAAALLRLDIVHGFVPVAFYLLALAGLVYLMARGIPRSWRLVMPLIAIALGAAAAVGVLWMIAATNVLGVSLSNSTSALTIAAFAAVALALWTVFARNGRGSAPGIGLRWKTTISRRLGAIVCAIAFLLAGTVAINADFGLYQTPAAMAGIAAGPIVSLPKIVVPAPTKTPELKAGGALWANWVAPADLPAVGTISQVIVPATVSGFGARPAQLYLPPAALVANAPALPLVVLMMGQPGNPDVSFAAAALNTYAARHGGLAPIVLSVDQLGNPNNDTLCIDSAKFGNVETYIVKDTLAWAQSHLHVLIDAAHSTVAGYSAGGECSLYFGAKYPALWGNVLDISGETYGGSERPRQTLASVFGGDQAAYDKIKPLNILTTGVYPNTMAIFTVGSNDSIFRAQAIRVNQATIAAGWATTYFEVPNGGHASVAINGGFVEGFRVLYPRLGLSEPGVAP